MHADISSINQYTNGFIDNFVIDKNRIDDVIILQCHYNIDHYCTALFNKLKIDLPVKLFNSVPKRQGEFLAGRFLAHSACKLLERSARTLPIGEQGVPVWPQGIYGSISHAQGRCICIAGRSNRKRIGVDIEKIAQGDALKAILDEALNVEEKKLVSELKFLDSQVIATLIFSAKEALFKALYPEVGDYFGFDAAMVCGIEKDGLLILKTTRKLHDNFPTGIEFKLQFKIEDDFVITFLVCAC
ncbi:4'-phosphopantetheinyl transferase [Brucellaceae bacterium D45D]